MSDGARGCGQRVEGGLYLMSELSPLGLPLEHFLVDPVAPWAGSLLRAPMLQKDRRGNPHLLLGVGAKYYPFIPDFVEEARTMGVSKRIPRDFDPTPLVPGKSKMVLIHPRGIPQFKYDADHSCPKTDSVKGHTCIGALWPLSLLQSVKRYHEVDSDTVTTPSATYRAIIPRRPTFNSLLKYRPGIFLGLPITGFHYVSRTKRVPPEVADRFKAARLPLDVRTE